MLDWDLDGLSLPLELSINVAQKPHEAGLGYWHATSPDWPGREGFGDTQLEAISYLMVGISNAQPLYQPCVDVLTAAGHGTDVVSAWGRHIFDSISTRRRHDGVQAVSLLDQYASWDVPGTLACEYIAAGLNWENAGRLHEVGLTPEDALPFVRRLGSFRGDYYGEYVELTFAENQDCIVEWVLSDFDLEAAIRYDEASFTTGEARIWSPVVEAHGLTMEDLSAIRQVGMSPSEAFRRGYEYGENGVTLGDAARTLIALG